MIVMSNPEHSELFPRGKHWNFVFIKVYTGAELAELEQRNRKVVVEIVRLKYLNAADAAKFLETLISEAGSITVNGGKTSLNLDFIKADNLSTVWSETIQLSSTNAQGGFQRFIYGWLSGAMFLLQSSFRKNGHIGRESSLCFSYS